MRIVSFILFFVSGTVFGQTISMPADFRLDKILVYLNNHNETLELLNNEYDRTASDEQKNERTKALQEADYFDRAINKNDRWAFGVDPKLFLWINESLTKILSKSKAHDYILVTKNTIDNYRIEEFKYVLKSNYILVNGEISDAWMIFYIEDRMTGESLINYDEPLKDNSFRPFLYVTGTNIIGTKIYPFYTFIRLFKVKKEWQTFFENI